MISCGTLKLMARYSCIAKKSSDVEANKQYKVATKSQMGNLYRYILQLSYNNNTQNGVWFCLHLADKITGFILLPDDSPSPLYTNYQLHTTNLTALLLACRAPCCVEEILKRATTPILHGDRTRYLAGKINCQHFIRLGAIGAVTANMPLNAKVLMFISGDVKGTRERGVVIRDDDSDPSLA